MKFLLLFVALMFSLVANAMQVENYTVSNDGRTLTVAYDDSIIRLYNLKTGHLLRQLKSHEDSIQTMNFNSDGTRLISGDWNDYAIIWDVTNGAVIKKKNMPNTVMHAIYAPDDRSLIMSIDEVPLAFFDKELNKKISDYPIFDRLQLATDKKHLVGQRMYGSQYEDEAVVVVDVLNNKKIMEIPESSYDDQIYISDDASIVVVRDFSRFHVWNVVSQKKVGVIDFQLDVDNALINPVNDQELWTTGDNKIEIWNYHTHKMMRSFEIKDFNVDEINAITFSPDGKTVALSLLLESDTGIVLLINPDDFSSKGSIKPKSNVALGGLFLDAETILLNAVKAIEVWNTKNKKLKYSLDQTEF